MLAIIVLYLHFRIVSNSTVLKGLYYISLLLYTNRLYKGDLRLFTTKYIIRYPGLVVRSIIY